MIILDNIIFSLQRNGGISVVFAELITRLLRGEFRGGVRFIEDSGKAGTNQCRAKLPIDSEFIIRRGENALSRYIPLLPEMKEPYVFHSTYYRWSRDPRAVNITTIHDFTYEYLFHGPRRWLHSFQKFSAVRRSKYVICVSENTRRDLLHLIPGVDPARVVVVHNGVSEIFRTSDEWDSSIPFAPGSYLLFVGSRTFYKNFGAAVAAAERFGAPLVAVGGGELDRSERRLVSKLADRGDFHHFSGASTELLKVLYNHARALLCLSWYEGFGIPVLEAQRCSCPVVALGRSSIPEVIGDGGVLVDSPDCETVCNALERFRDEEFRRVTVANGLRNAQRFSWDKCYEETAAVYRKAIAETQA